MLKRNAHTIVILSRIFDVVVILVAWYAAYFWRFGETHEIGGDFFLRYARQSIVLAILTAVLFRRMGAYSSARFRSIFQEIVNTVRMVLVVFSAQIMLIYFGGTEKISRLFLIEFLITSLAMMIIGHLFVRFSLRSIRAHGKNLRHAVLVGDGPQMMELSETLRANPGFGLSVRGWIDRPADAPAEIRDLGEFDMEKIRSIEPDLLVVGYSVKDFSRANRIFESLKTELIDLIMVPDTSHSLIGYQMVDLGGIPAISLNQARLSPSNLVVKRVIDMALSGLGLLVLSPFLFIIALGVKLTSRGPIFYGQKRMGLDGQTFTMWKFRSMKAGSDKEGAGWTVENDPRRTKFGTFLRQTSLDELPQLWNVFVGDMSLVGPRPEQPFYVEKFRQEVPAYMLRHRMKAGITGWAQVNGWRGNTSIVRRIECDIYYIKHWSPWLDVKILVLTFVKGFTHRNAY